MPKNPDYEESRNACLVSIVVGSSCVSKINCRLQHLLLGDQA